MISRTDSNQARIVADLRSIGASVCLLHEVGDGCPDLLIGFRGKNYLIEVKTVTGKKNQRQDKWHATWRGQVAVARTAKEAINIITGGSHE